MRRVEFFQKLKTLSAFALWSQVDWTGGRTLRSEIKCTLH